MGSSEFETKKFKKLKIQWDKRLAQSGFDDIENGDGSLKATTDSRTIRRSLKDKQERETYYSIAREFMNTYNWPEITDKLIWAAHIDGMGITPISHMLHITRYKVEITINKYRKLAKLRKK